MSTLEKPASEEGRLIRRPGPRETRPESAHRRRRALELSLAVAVPVVLVLLWQLAATQEWIDERVYPAPSAILSDGWERAVEGELWPDVWATLKRVLAGYAIGTVSGYLLGLLMGALPLVRAALEPMMDALYVVPKLALLPIFLNMFGLGEGPQIALVAATVFFFVWISTMAAVLAVPEGHRDAGAVFGSRPLADVPARAPAGLAAVRAGRGPHRRGCRGAGDRRLGVHRRLRRPGPPDLRLPCALPERRDVRGHRLRRRPGRDLLRARTDRRARADSLGAPRPGPGPVLTTHRRFPCAPLPSPGPPARPRCPPWS